jgi:hypothetical protein
LSLKIDVVADKVENVVQNWRIYIVVKVGVFLVWHKPPKFEMDLGRLAPVSEVTGGHAVPF